MVRGRRRIGADTSSEGGIVDVAIAAIPRWRAIAEIAAVLVVARSAVQTRVGRALVEFVFAVVAGYTRRATAEISLASKLTSAAILASDLLACCNRLIAIMT